MATKDEKDPLQPNGDPKPMDEVSTENVADIKPTIGVPDTTPHPAEENGSKAVLNADTPKKKEMPINTNPQEHTLVPSAQGSDIATKIQNA